MMNELTELRERIDAIDDRLLALLEQRMDVTAEIAAYKQKNRLPVQDHSREAQKLSSVAAKCRPETAAHLPHVFEAIMAASRAYQTELAKHG